MASIIKVGSNENVLGPSPKALAAIDAALADAYLYPEQQEALLRSRLAGFIGCGLKEENFVTGNGSCDVLRLIIQAYIRPGKKSLIAAPTFNLYGVLTEMFGGAVATVPLKNYTVDLEALAEAIDADTALVFVCNPNNPTGTIVTHDRVAAFLERVPNGVVTVFDEAYMEFVEDPAFPHMAEFIRAGHDVLVTRTFSKLHGLAGLRIGYGFGRDDLVEKARRNLLPFNGGRPAFVGATAALEDEDHIQHSLEMVRRGRQQYYRALDEMGIGYVPTESNFIFLSKLPMSAQRISEEATRRGIILRPTDPFGLPENLRITFARQDENALVLQALREIINAPA